MLDAAREAGLLKARGRSRTDSAHALAAVRELNRVELLAETLRAALNAIAVVAADWLRQVAEPDWHKRYDRRVKEGRLPPSGPKRYAHVVQVGADGFLLLDALNAPDAPSEAAALPAAAVLRRVWARHFERAGNSGDLDPDAPAQVRLRAAQGRGPGDRLESPYDADARVRAKSGTGRTGYMVHLTEACDAGAPRLVLHADTTPANLHEARRAEAIHAALAAKGLAPAEHLADAACVSAKHLVMARERYGIDLIGPARPDRSWQVKRKDAFLATDFAVDWERRRARCPEGRESTGWSEHQRSHDGEPCFRVGFSRADCRPCPSRARCTRSSSRRLTLHPQAQHEAIAATRARLTSQAGRRLHAQRQGVGATISQGVRAFGLRRSRRRGLAKTSLQCLATAAAINLDRLAAWLAERPLAPTRISRFPALSTRGRLRQQCPTVYDRHRCRTR